MNVISAPPEAWERVAAAVRQRRVGDLKKSQPELHAAGGPGIATISLIERHAKESYEDSVLWRLEDALGWKRGSILAILNRGEPTLAQSTSDSVTVDAGPRFQANRKYPASVAEHAFLRWIYDAPPEIATAKEKQWAARGVDLYWQDVGGREGALQDEQTDHGEQNVDERA